MALSKEEKERRLQERRQKKYDETHKLIDNIIHKICSDCQDWLPMNDDYFYTNKANGMDGYNPYCKKCTVIRSKKYQEDHPEQTKSYYKNRYREKEQYYKDNSRRWIEENKERSKELQKIWQQEHPDKVKEYNQDWNQRKKHNISKLEWENCKNYFNYRCAYCGLKIEEHWVKFKGELILGDFHKEHVDDFGANDLSNCVPSCKSCNTSKRTYELFEWYDDANPVFLIERLEKIIKWLNEDYKLYIKNRR